MINKFQEVIYNIKVYLLLEKADACKSTTIHKVFDEIVYKKCVQLILYRNKEIVATAHYNEKNIAFICKGDTPNAIVEECNILLENSSGNIRIDTLICVCRNNDYYSIDNLLMILECIKNSKSICNRDSINEIEVMSLDNYLLYNNGKVKYNFENDYITIVDLF